MGFYITDETQDRGPRAAAPPWGPKPARGPIREVISGYRFYNPDLGRWINRDPIGEIGGINIYQFTVNDPLNRYDLLGKISEDSDCGREVAACFIGAGAATAACFSGGVWTGGAACYLAIAAAGIGPCLDAIDCLKCDPGETKEETGTYYCWDDDPCDPPPRLKEGEFVTMYECTSRGWWRQTGQTRNCPK